jgi:hypothetical protein
MINCLNVIKSFLKLKDKSTPAIRKRRAKLFESRIFKIRIKRIKYEEIAMKRGKFDRHIWNEL